MLAAAAGRKADVQEDEIFGKDKRGDEMPDWASDKAKRLAKIQEAMAALEAITSTAKLGRGGRAPHRGTEKQQQRNAEGRRRSRADGATTTGPTQIGILVGGVGVFVCREFP